MSRMAGNVRNFPYATAADLEVGTRVTWNATDLVVGIDDAEQDVGTVNRRYESDLGLGSGHGRVDVLLKNAPGTRRMIANAAITAGLDVFKAAAGKVAPAGTRKVGVAITAAAADNDILEVLPSGGWD